MEDYKYQDVFSDHATNIFAFQSNTNNSSESEKLKIDLNNDIIQCFVNISISYKSGNPIQLIKHLSFLDNITLNNYFEPSKELLDNNIPNILIQIAFSNKFSLKCILLSLSIIENLTFEDQYGFIQFFYDLGIITNACFCLESADNLGVILYIIRILINYSENQKKYAEEILRAISLDEFIPFILNISDTDEKLVRKVKYYSATLLCQLSFISSNQFTKYFYAFVDYLLNNYPLYDQSYNLSRSIFWIVSKCIESDQKYIQIFFENDVLIQLLNESINNYQNDFSNFKLALIILSRFYQNSDFVMTQELNLENLIKSISLFNYGDNSLVPLLFIIRKNINLPQHSVFANDKSLISYFSEIFFNSVFSIRVEIVRLLCAIIEKSPIDFLPCFINNHIIQMIFEIYDSEENDFRVILLQTLIKLIESVYCFDVNSRCIFSDELSEIDLGVLDGSVENSYNHLINHFQQLYNDFINSSTTFK